MLEARFTVQTASVPDFSARKKITERLIWEQLTGPAIARKAGVDLFHIPYFAPSLNSRIPTIITIHDVIQLLLPSYRVGTKKKLYLDLAARAARKASLIITISQHARQDIVDTLKIPPERIRVTYLAAGDEFSPISDPAVLAKRVLVMAWVSAISSILVDLTSVRTCCRSYKPSLPSTGNPMILICNCSLPVTQISAAGLCTLILGQSLQN